MFVADMTKTKQNLKLLGPGLRVKQFSANSPLPVCHLTEWTQALSWSLAAEDVTSQVVA